MVWCDATIRVEKMIHSWAQMIKEWLGRSYEVEKADLVRMVVGRFSRGNVSVQQGLYLTRHELVELGRKGDEAIANLQKSEAA